MRRENRIFSCFIIANGQPVGRWRGFGIVSRRMVNVHGGAIVVGSAASCSVAYHRAMAAY